MDLRSTFLAGAMAASLVQATTALAGEPGPADRRMVAATAPHLFLIAEQYAQAGLSERAEMILAALARDPNADIRNEARFRHALLLEAKGRHRDAAILLRQLLDDRPDAQSARLKLATMLQKLGDEGAALRELRALRTTDLPPTAARFVDRLSASLQASKPFGVQVEFAVAPDSNVNRATRSDTLGTVIGDFTIDEDTKAKSGLGASVRGMAHARMRMSDRLNLATRASLEGNLYREKDFNDISLDVSLGPELRIGRTRFSAEGGIVHQWYGMAPYQRSIRAHASAVRPVGPVTQLRLDLGLRWTENKRNDLQDGRGLSSRVRVERAISPTTLISASVGYDRYLARDDAYSTRSVVGSLTAYRELGRATLSAGIEMARLKADERLQILPEARKDRMMRFHLGSVWRQFAIGGFAPMTRLVVERNRSSVEFYDYRRVRTEFGITRAF